MSWIISLLSAPFFKAFFSFIDKYVTIILGGIEKKLEEDAMKKATAVKMAEIMKESDPAVRARRLKDLLSG